MKVLANWHKYPKANSRAEMIPKKIYRSWLPNKKLVVMYNNKIIHFGDKNYSNYGIHKSKARLINYLNRSSKIKNKYGKLTLNDPNYANYWSRRILWNRSVI